MSWLVTMSYWRFATLVWQRKLWTIFLLWRLGFPFAGWHLKHSSMGISVKNQMCKWMHQNEWNSTSVLFVSPSLIVSLFLAWLVQVGLWCVLVGDIQHRWAYKTMCTTVNLHGTVHKPCGVYSLNNYYIMTQEWGQKNLLISIIPPWVEDKRLAFRVILDVVQKDCFLLLLCCQIKCKVIATNLFRSGLG